ncbi:MAG: xanthine dehydrogenase family protein molybdopterin-binding subunit [Mesorhizobium sp.]|nr:molybdopterin cofactor-binding domain-containing protein [Mesorhizobium sp.]RWK18287.1 MAG: xanthine dehydrogenase family protein molybdopterin-binding subunit [Mesorhizobium sp.]
MTEPTAPSSALTRRSFFQTAAGMIALSITGLPRLAHAATPANVLAQIGTNASPIPGIAAERIDGRAKVTGQKVFARDFNARDMPGWPARQWYALYLYALTTDHAFLGVNLTGLPDTAQPKRLILGDSLSGRFIAPRVRGRRDLHVDEHLHGLVASGDSSSFDRPADIEFDLIVKPGNVPDFLGQAVALLLFDSAAGFRAARNALQFRDAEFQIYAIDAGHSKGMGSVFPPETTYVKYTLDNENFSYATADPATYMAQVPGYRERIAAALAADPSHLSQPVAFDKQAMDPMFMEPETGIAWYEAGARALHLVLGTQSPDGDIADIAGIYGATDAPVKVTDIHLISCYPGGGFGGRDSSPFSLMLALAAPFADGNPVRLEFDRFEQFRTGLKRQAVRIEGQLSVGAGMKMLAAQMALRFDGGGRKNLNPYVASLAALCAGGAYQLPMADIFANATHTQNVSGGSQRGFGGPEAYFAIETALDDLAAQKGWDPLALRRANLVADDGTTVAGGPIAQELRLPEILDIAEAHPLWRDRATIKADFASRGETYGTGLALSLQAYGTSGDGMVAAVHLDANGKIRVESDAVDMGNGSATTLGVVIGPILGANAARVDMACYTLWGQTGLTTKDTTGARWANPDWTQKSVGSSSACLTGLHQVHVVQQTARALFEGSVMAAARKLWQRPDIDATQTRWQDGALLATDGALPPLSLADLGQTIHRQGLPSGALGHAYFQVQWVEADFLTPGGLLNLQLDGLSYYAPEADNPQRVVRQNTNGPDAISKRYARYVWAPCLNIVGLTVNRSNGQVRVENVVSILNAGRVHVPELVSGQSQGGIAMALSQTLLEDMPPGMEGPANGQWNLNRYHLARMQDVPLGVEYRPGARAQELIILPETPGDGRAGRGIAEAVMCSVAPAISNALRDAVG